MRRSRDARARALLGGPSGNTTHNPTHRTRLWAPNPSPHAPQPHRPGGVQDGEEREADVDEEEDEPKVAWPRPSRTLNRSPTLAPLRFAEAPHML